MGCMWEGNLGHWCGGRDVDSGDGIGGGNYMLV